MMKAAFINLATTISIAVLLLAGGLNGQISPKEKAQAKEKAKAEVRKWQTRVDDLTKEIVSESAAVSDSERPLYLALLAKFWWSVDQKEARVHLKASADKLLVSFRADDAGNDANRARFSKRSLEIITVLDEKFALELVGRIEDAVNDSGENNRKENPEMAELLAEFGLRLVAKKREAALAFGLNSLVYGLATSLPGLISELNIQDSAKAELLYRRAMTKVQGNYSRTGLVFESLLGRYMFGVYGDKGFSTQMRTAFLSSYADRVTAAALVENNRQARCQIASYASVMITHVDEYLPSQSQALRQNLQSCTPYLADVLQELTRAETNVDQPKTVDDFVHAAIEARDRHLKVRYWREAMSRLEKEERYAEMISILDATDGDDLKAAAPVVWDNRRINAAYQAAMVSFEAKDFPATYRIIERTPKRIRPDVRMRIVKKLKPTNDN